MGAIQIGGMAATARVETPACHVKCVEAQLHMADAEFIRRVREQRRRHRIRQPLRYKVHLRPSCHI